VTVNELRQQRGGFVDVYEALAAMFRRTSRMLAPGKDYPAALGEPFTWEQRREAWQVFCLSLGPSDKAAIVAEWIRHTTPVDE